MNTHRRIFWYVHLIFNVSRSIEFMIHESIVMDGDNETNHSSLMTALRNRPTSFFAQSVKNLSIVGEIPLPFVVLVFDTCPNNKHISLCQSFPYYPVTTTVTLTFTAFSLIGLLCILLSTVLSHFQSYDIKASLVASVLFVFDPARSLVSDHEFSFYHLRSVRVSIYGHGPPANYCISGSTPSFHSLMCKVDGVA